MNSFIIFLIFVTISLSSAIKLPASFKRCKSNDMTCLKDAIQDALPKLKDGLKDLGVPSLSPLVIPKMTIGAGNIVKLVQNYENSKCYGLSDSIVKEVSLDMDKGKLVIDVEGKLAEMNASYTINGKILILDVYGSGECMIRIEGLKGQFTLDLETYIKNNNKYLKGTNADLVLHCEQATFQFDNLFDGNKQLGDNINKVLNDNWKQIYEELSPAYMKSIAISLLNLTNKLFSKIPIQDMFLN
ncbi:hypothetical protein WA026_021931 [Henosepilachna vigintioctopunctata]|uniref:Protein takeout-like n=1 Tax=Henosepilachna vigintioctopunctata TaxID=420089 RepID=A0AAW1VJE1_9CUCU